MKVENRNYGKYYILESEKEKIFVLRKIISLIKSGYFSYDDKLDRLIDSRHNTQVHYSEIENNKVAIAMINDKAMIEFQLDKNHCREFINSFK